MLDIRTYSTYSSKVISFEKSPFRPFQSQKAIILCFFCKFSYFATSIFYSYISTLIRHFLLSLGYFEQYNVLSVHPSSCKGQNIFIF